jgi:hypothetical protein
MKNYKIMLMALTFLSAMAITASADYTCVNASASQFSTVISVSGSPIAIAYDEMCQFNCSSTTGECNPPPTDNIWLELFIFLAIALILLYIGKSLSEEDWFLQLLFLIAAMALIVATLGLLMTKEELTNNTLFSGPVNYIYWFAIVIMMVIIFYYMIKTILKVLFKVSDLKKGH